MIKNTKVQVASLVLIFTLSFVYFANHQYFAAVVKNGEIAQNSRFPASIGESTMASTNLKNASDLSRAELTETEENDLAEEVAKVDPSRDPASIGQPANDLENLRFQKLEGRYAFETKDDTISHITLNEDAQSVAIPDRADFLKTFAHQFGVQDKPQRVSSVSKGDTVIETYRMKAANEVSGKSSDRLIRVTIGQANGLLEITSEVAPENHIF